MRLIVDSNDYIFAFGASKEFFSLALFEHIKNYPTLYSIHICRSIVNEIKRNLPDSNFQDFYNFISLVTSIDEDYIVPFELGVKYESYGLKPGDAFIAAYAEYVQADLLVSENRHFLSRRPDLPFQVLNAQECLKKLRA